MPKSKEQTVPDILRKYQDAQGFETDMAFADALSISRQSMSQWLNETHQPSVDVLKLWALMYVFLSPWKSRMAVELLKTMGHEGEVPCTCLQMGDNIYCPRHTLMEVRS